MIWKIFNKKRTLFSVLLLAIAFYFLFFHNIWSYPLMDIDETRYVLMSRDMLHSKDFLTLYLNGEYFFEKPPLYFWIECISFKLFGFVNEFSARFPASLCGVLLSFLVYFTGKKVVSPKYALVSSLVLATSLEFVILSKYAILDIFLCAFIAFSVFSYFLTLFVQDKNKKYFWWMFYAFSALAVMAKGIPGFVIPFGVVFFVSLYTRTFKQIFRPVYILPGIILFLLITLPWHIAMIEKHQTFFHEYVIKHHLQRFVNSKDLGRKQPFWFFFVTLLWGMVPWIASMLAVAVEKLRGIKFEVPRDNKKLFLHINIIAALFTFLFFSSSSTKLVTYILPIYPFLACITGYVWTEYVFENKYQKVIDISVYVFSGVCVLCAIAAIFMKYYLPEGIYADISTIQWFSILSILVTQIPAIVFLLKKNRFGVFLSYVVFIILLSAFGTPKFYNLDYKFGQNDLMEYTKYAKANKQKLYALNTGRRFSLNYYGDSKNVFYVINEDYFDLVKNLKTGGDSLFVVRKKEYKKHEKAFSDFKILKQGAKYLLLKKYTKKDID